MKTNFHPPGTFVSNALTLMLFMTCALVTLTHAQVLAYTPADWSSMGVPPGAKGVVNVLVADDSGVVYIGGQFTAIGNVPAMDIAKWDGERWSPLGSGIGKGNFGASTRVSAMVLKEHDLYVGGRFTTAGGRGVNGIAKWDGEEWTPLGEGVAGADERLPEVSALAVLGNDLYVGGVFTKAGGQNIENIAKWDGQQWSPLGPGLDGPVRALAVSDGELYAGGDFRFAGEDAAFRIAKWDGEKWSSFGAKPTSEVTTLAFVGRDLYIGSGSREPSWSENDSSVAKWDGEQWSWLPSRMVNVASLAVIGQDLYAMGGRSGVEDKGPRIAKWDGNKWSMIGPEESWWNGALGVGGDELFAAGAWDPDAIYFGFSGSSRISRWNGEEWSHIPEQTFGLDNHVTALLASERHLYVGGRFSSAGGKAANRVAAWDGHHWSALGNGLGGGCGQIDGTHAEPKDFAMLGNDLYAGGSFTSADGKEALRIAKWDGERWSALGAGIGEVGWAPDGQGLNCASDVYALATLDGNLYAAGQFDTAGGEEIHNIAMWDGSEWSALSEGIESRYVSDLAVIGNDLYARGKFIVAGEELTSGTAKWDGREWTIVDPRNNSSLSDLAVIGDDLYVAGNKWGGPTWLPLVSGLPNYVGSTLTVSGGSLTVSGGSLYAVGSFEWVDPTCNRQGPETTIAKWNGQDWSLQRFGSSGSVSSIAAFGTDVYLGSYSGFARGQAFTYLARVSLGGPVSPILEVAVDNAVHVEFLPVNSDENYVLEQSATLLPDSWRAVEIANLDRTDDLLRFTVEKPDDANQNFYRVVSLEPSPPAPLFVEDFENGAEGWTTTTTAGDTEWELGKPSAMNLTEAHSGERVYGTDLDAPLSNGSIASLRSPAIDLSGFDCARLHFWYSVDAAIESEGVKLRIHSEDGNLLHEREEIFWGTTGAWTRFSMIIPEEAKNQKIRLEWLLLTDDADPNGDGFFLDDVVIE